MGSQTRVPFSPSSLVFERKFDVALRKSHGDSFKRRLSSEKLSPDDHQLMTAAEMKSRIFGPPDSWETNVNLYPQVLGALADVQLPRGSGRLTRILRLVETNLEIQLGWVCSGLEPSLRPDLKAAVAGTRRRAARCTWLHRLMAAKEELDKLLSAVPAADGGRRRGETPEEAHRRLGKECFWRSKLLGLSVVWSRHSCVMFHDSTAYYLPRSYLLLCHNKVCDMISVLFYACACPDALYGLDLVSLTCRFIDIWSALARRLDQRFFHVSKVLEGLCIGETLIDVEGEGNRGFLDNICDGLYAACGFQYKGSELQTLIQGAPIPVKHELACLSKTMGHPFCDVEKGAATLQQKVNDSTVIDTEAVVQCVRYAKMDFIRKFLAKEKRWPLVELTSEASRGLKFAQMLNADPKNPDHQRKYGQILLTDMDQVTVLPNIKFDWLENFIPYVKDRTVTLDRSAVVRRYIEGSKDLRDNWKDTRLLLFYLMQPVHMTDHMWYLQAYNRGDWEQVANYLVIRIVPKEKEHKIESRGFGCKTPMDRARGIIQEENAARFLDKYSDEHVMTLGEITLAKKLLGFRQLGKAYQGYTCLTMSVDSSSWNNRFRSQAVAPVAEAVLDASYGVKIFKKTHTAYERSFIYMPDADQVYSWDGQLGGIEGLNQDTWVYVYLQQMKVCMEGLPYPYYLLCKGDDLRVAIMVPPEVREKKSLDVIKQEVLAHVSERGKLFGHVIKVEDSYVSECYFAYSKDAYVAGVEQPQTFRKIQKCYGANNAFLTTVDDYIASSFSNAHSASKNAPSPIQCFITALFWSYDALTLHAKYGELCDEELVALLCAPNLVGGFPIIFLHNFFVRAESDLLSPFIDLLQYTKKHYPRIFDLLCGFITQKVMRPEKVLSGLLIDPYSLPLAKPTQAGTVLRQAVTELVERTTKNEDLKELFRAVKGGFERAFLDVLLTSNVYNVKLMGVLFSCTPEGIIRALIRKFETGRSIYNALILHAGRGITFRILKKCANADKAAHEYRIALLKQKIRGSQHIVDLAELGEACPYAIAKRTRDTLWGKPVEGITHPPLQHMISVGTVASFRATDEAAYNHFEIMFDLSDRPPRQGPLFTIGRHDPFTGDSTGRGLHHPDATIISHNMLSSKVRDLVDTLQWSHMTGVVNGRLVASNLPLLVEHLLRAYTKTEISDLVPFQAEKVIGRTTQHHVRVNNYRVAIVPNTLLNVYTRAKGTSHTHRNFFNSTDHYLVNFLHVFCHTVSLWALKWWCGEDATPPDRIWAVTRSYCECLKPIEEVPVVLQETNLPSISVMEACRVADVAIREILQEVQEFNPLQYYVAEDAEEGITLEEAQIALAQAHSNAVVAARHTIKALYTSHATTSSGYKALEKYGGLNSSAETEALDLRYVPPEILLRDIAVMVYSEILQRYNFSTIADLGVALGLTPALELPWTTLLQDLDFAGVWYSAQQQLHRLVPTTYDIVYDNPITAAPAFGHACYSLCRGTLKDYKVAYLSYNPSPLVEKDIARRLHAIRLDVFQQVYSQLIRELEDENTPASRVEEIGLSLAIGVMADEEFRFPFTEDGAQATRAVSPLFVPPDDVEEVLASQHQPDETGEVVWSPPPLAVGVCRVLGQDLDLIQFWLEQLVAQDLEVSAWERFADNVGVVTVEIFRTTRVTCINRVRSERLPLYHVAGTMNSLQPQSLKSFHRHQLPSIEITPLEAEAASVYPPVGYDWGIKPDPEFKGTLFNKRWLTRPFGAGNISMSKGLSLLEGLGILPLEKQLSIMCLGDGFGGYTALFSCLGRDSWILFNTRPNRQGAEQIPIHALELAEGHGNRLDFSENQLGYYDLCQSDTYERFESRTERVDLITLDAEMQPLLCAERVAMLHYVCTLFVRKGSRGSVLLLKVMSMEAQQWMGVLGWLAPLCQRVYLVKAPAAPLDGELFLAAQLNLPSPNRRYGVHPAWPPTPLVTKIHLFAQIKYNRWIEKDEGGLNEIGLKPSYSQLWIELARLLPLYGWSKLHEVCRLSVDLQCKFRQGMPENQWLRHILSFLEPACAQYCMELRQISPDKHSMDYMTVKHEAYTLERFAAVAGFREVIRVRLTNRDVLTAKDCNDGYDNFVRGYPGKLHLLKDLPEHKKGAITRAGYTIHPFRWWKLGLRWGVAATSISRLV
ncbi:polymerase [Changping Tick Virus 2]|uniref:RNA-directed RNA polymerase n=1 Tax=Changping Tick Virus 2 TaxID=1608044 RepID=A0A0B5KEM5_9VIRU|nr:polymerase [Changping Tick Virus 2]AJG39044.1 polymerase [Changping Tick Virus 2]